jgi:hypothetical protein
VLADADQVLTSEDVGRITFSAGWKEFELRLLQEAAAPLSERQCVFERWPRPAKRQSFILVDAVSRSRRPGEMAGVH